MQERNDRAGGLVDDLLDQLQRMLRALAEADEGDVRVLPRCDRADLADLDLRGDHLVPQAGHDGRNGGKTILALVRDEHTKSFHVPAPRQPDTCRNRACTPVGRGAKPPLSGKFTT